MFEEEGIETLSCSIRGVLLSTADTPRSVHMVCGIWYVVYVGFVICDRYIFLRRRVVVKLLAAQSEVSCFQPLTPCKNFDNNTQRVISSHPLTMRRRGSLLVSCILKICPQMWDFFTSPGWGEEASWENINILFKINCSPSSSSRESWSGVFKAEMPTPWIQSNNIWPWTQQ